MKELRALQRNLSFKERQVKEVFKLVFKKMHATWDLKESHCDDWSGKNTKRLRNMCFVVSKELRRPRVPKWLKDLGLADDAAPKSPKKKEKEPSDDEESEDEDDDADEDGSSDEDEDEEPRRDEGGGRRRREEGEVEEELVCPWLEEGGRRERKEEG